MKTNTNLNILMTYFGKIIQNNHHYAHICMQYIIHIIYFLDSK